MRYTLAPGGSFESSAGLTLTGGATIVAGNETSYVNSPTDKSSVLIPRGGTVTTGPICVGIDKPTVRFLRQAADVRAAAAADRRGRVHDQDGRDGVPAARGRAGRR